MLPRGGERAERARRALPQPRRATSCRARARTRRGRRTEEQCWVRGFLCLLKVARQCAARVTLTCERLKRWSGRLSGRLSHPGVRSPAEAAPPQPDNKCRLKFHPSPHTHHPHSWQSIGSRPGGARARQVGRQREACTRRTANTKHDGSGAEVACRAGASLAGRRGRAHSREGTQGRRSRRAPRKKSCLRRKSGPLAAVYATRLPPLLLAAAASRRCCCRCRAFCAEPAAAGPPLQTVLYSSSASGSALKPTRWRYAPAPPYCAPLPYIWITAIASPGAGSP